MAFVGYLGQYVDGSRGRTFQPLVICADCWVQQKWWASCQPNTSDHTSVAAVSPKLFRHQPPMLLCLTILKLTMIYSFMSPVPASPLGASSTPDKKKRGMVARYQAQISRSMMFSAHLLLDMCKASLLACMCRLRCRPHLATRARPVAEVGINIKHLHDSFCTNRKLIMGSNDPQPSRGWPSCKALNPPSTQCCWTKSPLCAEHPEERHGAAYVQAH